MKISCIWRSIYHRGPMDFGMLLLAVILLNFSLPARAQEEEATPSATSDIKTPCKGLKSYNNLDELLYQFYINMESNCLFEMSQEELEKIWGVKILNNKNLINKDYDRLDFVEKPYNNEKDAFYILLSKNAIADQSDQAATRLAVSFKIIITKEYRERYGVLFPQHNFPKLLPPPRGYRHDMPQYGSSSYGTTGFGGSPLPPPRVMVPKGDYDFSRAFYYWLNSDMSSMMVMYGLGSIEITNSVPPGPKSKFGPK